MTRKIEEVLGLPSLESVLDQNKVDEVLDAVEQSIGIPDDSDLYLVDPDSIKIHDQEMDTIHDAAIAAHKDMIDMGFNMEPKNAGSVFDPAARMLEIALKASQSKVDMRMKSYKAKIDREKLDNELEKNKTEGVIDGEVNTGTLLDRNQLLASIKNKNNI
jgi:hypothetical protein